MNDLKSQLNSAQPKIKQLSRSDDYDRRDMGFQIERAFNAVWFANRHLQAGANGYEMAVFQAIVADEEFRATIERLERGYDSEFSEAEILAALTMQRRLRSQYHSVKPLIGEPRNGRIQLDDPFDEAVAFTRDLEGTADLNARDLAEECDSCLHAIWLARKAAIDEGNPVDQAKYRALAHDPEFWRQFEEFKSKAEKGLVSDEDIVDMHLLRRKLWKELLALRAHPES